MAARPHLSDGPCGAEQWRRTCTALATPFATTHNPLRQLPSVLAIPDLQRRLSRVLRELPVGEDELVALLKIDPLAVIRGLRAASSVVFRQANALPTVRGIVRSIGPTLSKRLFRQTNCSATGGDGLQKLWHHAIATAHAAEELATRTGLLEPEVAYVMGLVHDLPLWLRMLGEREGEPQCKAQPTDWILHWQLPAPFVSLMLAIDMGDRPTTTQDPPDPTGMILAAELLAELAGFPHPEHNGDEWFEDIASQLDKSELLFTQKLRRKVEASLRSFGLSPDLTEAEISASTTDLTFDQTAGKLDEVVLSILGCTGSESYRGIVTALTAAAVRYGNYDRAFYAKWHDASATLTLRSKADSSSRRMVRTRLQVSGEEANRLRRALETRAPEHLATTPNSSAGVLRMLSTDELLAIPLNCDFETPAFLLLDRSLTLAPLEVSDLTLATMLGMTGSLLIDNLLLRRRRQRAQKFALTDPLTRLFNRRMGILALEQSLARSERDRRPLTVLMCDLDHFKRLNDTLGHVTGDAALRATADVLRHAVRKADTLCRYGGEEFLVVLPDTTPDEATVLATRMFTAVHARGEELGLPITISIGLTSHRPGDTVESILIRADRALYASKGYGRNRFSADIEEDERGVVGAIEATPPDVPGPESSEPFRPQGPPEPPEPPAEA